MTKSCEVVCSRSARQPLPRLTRKALLRLRSLTFALSFGGAELRDRADYRDRPSGSRSRPRSTARQSRCRKARSCQRSSPEGCPVSDSDDDSETLKALPDCGSRLDPEEARAGDGELTRSYFGVQQPRTYNRELSELREFTKARSCFVFQQSLTWIASFSWLRLCR